MSNKKWDYNFAPGEGPELDRWERQNDSTELADAKAQLEKLREVLVEIRDDTDSENPESYRNADSNGCLETVNWLAESALKFLITAKAKGDPA